MEEYRAKLAIRRSAPAGVALRAAAFEGVRDRRLALRELAGARARVIDALPAEAAGPLLAAWLDERRTL